MSCKLSASSLTRRSVATLVTIFLLAVLIIGIYTDHRQVEEFNTVPSDRNTLSVAHRRLLNIAPGPANTQLAENKKTVEPNRIWSDKCSTSDIMISQGPTQPLPSGIPTYTVEITNMCVSGCDISRIHLKCGWFSSARLVNPKVFKRLHFDDCLVNDGKPLVNGRTLSFQYANTYRYPLVVSSITC